MAKASLGDIRLDVSGYRLQRSSLTEKISEALTRSRFVQITGEPGTGKSAVLRSIAEGDERNGFVFVLSEKRIEGNGWVGFATANGLTSPSATALLAEIGASGNPILFIDGIDRIVLKSAQLVVADILRTIATELSCAHWRVVASVRDENIEHVRTWMPSEFLAQTGVASIEVGLFDDDEAAQIGKALPALASLLNAVGPVREIARRPFFLRVLAEGVGRQDGVSAPRSEIELIDAWWSRGGYDAARADARRRQQVLLTAAEKGVLSFGRRINAVGLDANAVQDLVEDSIIRDVQPGINIGFTHDVFFEWSLFQLARSRGGGWLDLVKDAGEPPFFGRIVSLLSQRAFERDEDWQKGLEALETASARSQWKRAWLIAPFSSPLFATYQDRFDGAFHQNP
ncbi:MAG: ATP-binding protein, partial [Candidatus Acidiferrales bacterium]